MRHAVRSATPISAPSSSKRRRSRSAVAAGLSVNLPPGDRFDASAVESEQQSLAALAGVSVPLSQRPFSQANLRVGRSSSQGMVNRRTVERELLRHVGRVDEERQRGGVDLLAEEVERLAVRPA